MPFAGTIRVPSDKSISHRAVLFAGLAQGVSHLEAVLPSADVQATIRAIRALGARVDLVAGPHGLVGEVEGIGLAASKSTRPLVIDCGNSGTTARLLMGALAGLDVEATLVGDASLSVRPMRRVTDQLSKLGARFESDGGHLPVRIVRAGALHGAHVVTEQASAQVKSAILARWHGGIGNDERDRARQEPRSHRIALGPPLASMSTSMASPLPSRDRYSCTRTI